MPLNPETQRKLGELEKHVLDILGRDGGRPVNDTNKALLVQAARHLTGLSSSLKQLDARLEKRAWDVLAAFFGERAKRPPLHEVAVVGKEDPVSKEIGKTKKRTNK